MLGIPGLKAIFWGIACAFLVGLAPSEQLQKDILFGAKLAAGFDMGVTSSERRTNWLKTEGDHLGMFYPPGESWGAVFITVGKPKQPPRPFRDFSAYKSLAIEMRGERGGEQLEIGIKTNTQSDDGSETKIPVTLSSDWKTYEFSLEKFDGTHPGKLYVVAEFVFSGSDAATVYVRNIRYLNTYK